jgi:cyclopropane-fatty-acyl-phospholipid synthase
MVVYQEAAEFIQSPNTTARDRVVTCYSAVDRFFPACGLYDLTEGIYQGNPEMPHEQAQANQHNYLLEQALCGPGQRLLDIGCGYGTLLERARQHGALGTGITISPEQVEYCQSRQLDVVHLDYRALSRQWNATFDCVIANGSIEHFVQPEDAAAGQADNIYRQLFGAVHQLIDPRSAARRFVTTTIHFVRSPTDPLALRRSPVRCRWGTDGFHWSVLERGWGGYYPDIGQLQRCAEGYFELIEEVDGTEDYRLTSEEWMRRVRRALRSWRVVTIVHRSLPVLLRAPRQLLALLIGTLVSESWSWQFRPPNPPTRLLRQTWAFRD